MRPRYPRTVPDSPAQSRIVQAVLFDMDGTLIDSTPAVERSWRRWGEHWGLGDVFGTHEHGMPARDIVAGHLPADRVSAGFAMIEAMEVSDTDGIVTLPGAEALLAGLPADRWAIVTSCSAPLAAARVRATGLRPPVLVTASDTERGKPNPDPYLAAAERLGIDPRDCLVVEDAPAGLAAGRAAGCVTLGVGGTLAHDELEADLVARSLEDVRVEPTPSGLLVTVTG
jgi:mannitol-1-/sugar-/sorbitol-6-phosphatase